MLKKNVLLAFLFALVTAPVLGMDASELPNPLRNCQIGQWVLYKIQIMGVEAEQKQSIIAIEGTGDDRFLTMRVEILVEGLVAESEAERVSYKDAVAELRSAFKDNPDARFERVTMQVKGQDVDAVKVSYVDEGIENRIYLSEVVPIVGIVKLEVESEEGAVMELIDFGD